MNIEKKTYPDLMTEAEVIDYLRIPEVSKSQNYKNVISHLKRVRDLPRIHICSKTLFPLKAVQEWINKQTTAWR
jgi:hypothetical protein